MANSNRVTLWDKEKLTSMVKKVENEFIAYQESFSDEIIPWVDRIQLIEDWLQDYEKLKEIGGFNELNVKTIAYVDELPSSCLSI